MSDIQHKYTTSRHFTIHQLLRLRKITQITPACSILIYFFPFSSNKLQLYVFFKAEYVKLLGTKSYLQHNLHKYFTSVKAIPQTGENYQTKLVAPSVNYNLRKPQKKDRTTTTAHNSPRTTQEQIKPFKSPKNSHS